MKIEIPMPAIPDQQAFIFKAATEAAIQQLRANLDAPVLPGLAEFDITFDDHAHLLRENEGWVAPCNDLVDAYFKHFQKAFPEYGTDAKLAKLLGLLGQASDRRIREYKQGRYKVPYNVWRRFLVITGRAPQEIIPVLAFMA